MVRQVEYTSWRDLPLSNTIDLLGRLQAGVIYCPQHFPEAITHIAFAARESDDRLVSAIEGLDLALAIAEDLALSYSIYSSDQATICGIRRAASRVLELGDRTLPSWRRR